MAEWAYQCRAFLDSGDDDDAAAAEEDNESEPDLEKESEGLASSVASQW